MPLHNSRTGILFFTRLPSQSMTYSGQKTCMCFVQPCKKRALTFTLTSYPNPILLHNSCIHAWMLIWFYRLPVVFLMFNVKVTHLVQASLRKMGTSRGLPNKFTRISSLKFMIWGKVLINFLIYTMSNNKFWNVFAECIIYIKNR
jgi:hypothetical protein